MWGIAREWGTLSTFNAFKGEGRHQSLKSEIRKRSFKGGSKKRGSRLMGGEPSIEDGVGRSASERQPAKGFNVWQHSSTRQDAYWNAKQYWERVMRKGKF